MFSLLDFRCRALERLTSYEARGKILLKIENNRNTILTQASEHGSEQTVSLVFSKCAVSTQFNHPVQQGLSIRPLDRGSGGTRHANAQ